MEKEKGPRAKSRTLEKELAKIQVLTFSNFQTLQGRRRLVAEKSLEKSQRHELSTTPGHHPLATMKEDEMALEVMDG